MTIPVVMSHADFVVVNKPCGISVQDEASAPGLLRPLCQQLGVDKLWLVHRLDKVTSGLLVLATHADAAAILSGLFAQRKISKYYLALLTSKPAKKQGSIIGDMKKVRDGKWILLKSKDAPAVSQFFSCAHSPGKRLAIIKPYTGKTHQIRVAMKSLGSPILGDRLYTGEAAERTYLHAYALAFRYQDTDYSLDCLPQQGQYFNGEDFDRALLQYNNPGALPWPKLSTALIAKTGARL